MPVTARQYVAPVISNVEIIRDHKVITFIAPEIAAEARPGHFVNILVSDAFDPFLRKPFSIYTVDRVSGEVTVLYSIVGATTRGMSRKRAGDTLDLVGPLGGTIFAPAADPATHHIMVGGGYGVPPLVFLSRELHAATDPLKLSFLIGARHKDLLLCEAELHDAGFDTRVSTEDGSRGAKGRVTDVLEPLFQELAGAPAQVYCCGPTPMMRAVGDLSERYNVPCQVSIEVAMPCGMGVCMACVIDTRGGKRLRSCTDGPVFDSREVAW